ncbi:uncharacterized protein LOC127246773 [Andrographis paniculata]|uniref:uncharacterized protein LOC127246773 n=1 Tax=Andrographis paniculata TaxID=175694 RepID=UPI0021E91E76|nr:uncharacterized protein LOC127246773 [Andrographis paniculata]XP_051124274.1 uncharacterized protein LOC127246773 [Andrographis paniculata]XP_051124275.1 uncharacterized protein LOC127246773 [Andrographis paniculata]
MSSKRRGNAQSSIKPEKEKAEMQRRRAVKAEKATKIRNTSSRERKIALQQDIDKLKKKLRHEENIRRALERAFTRPLGALPRLPSYLPPNTLELLAEVAVLEEEVVCLEEKVVHFRQGLYQEAVYISSSKKNRDDNAADDDDLCVPCQINDDPKPNQSKSLLQAEPNSSASIEGNQPSLSDQRRGKENQTSTNPTKNKQQSPNLKAAQTIRHPAKRPPIESRSSDRRLEPQRPQRETCVKPSHQSSEDIFPVDDNPNKISETLIKCLMNIYLRMGSNKNRSSTRTLPTPDMLKDPYRICSKFGKRDIGPYKHLSSIETLCTNPNQMMVSALPFQRLKLLLGELESVDLKGLNHQEKLAFWINVYNACMMNAFIEYGIPESPEMTVALMQKATLNVGGQLLNAVTIEHFILRLPYHSKHTLLKGLKHDEATKCNSFGLELSEPLVTFGLSCGSWSSPAVRVYTSSQVENELESAKREYLQAAIGISTSRKVVAIPKLLDWYLLDFAKDMESFLDWICLQLPCELGKEAIKCLERRHGEPLLQLHRIMPYDFSFRYLLHTS